MVLVVRNRLQRHNLRNASANDHSALKIDGLRLLLVHIGDDRLGRRQRLTRHRTDDGACNSANRRADRTKHKCPGERTAGSTGATADPLITLGVERLVLVIGLPIDLRLEGHRRGRCRRLRDRCCLVDEILGIGPTANLAIGDIAPGHRVVAAMNHDGIGCSDNGDDRVGRSGTGADVEIEFRRRGHVLRDGQARNRYRSRECQGNQFRHSGHFRLAPLLRPAPQRADR